MRQAFSDQTPKWRPRMPTTVPSAMRASGQKSLVHPQPVHLPAPKGLDGPCERSIPHTQPSSAVVCRVPGRRAVARGAHLGVGEGQGSLRLEEAPDLRLSRFSKQYHVLRPPICFFAATASSSARSLPLLCAPSVFWCALTFLHRTSRWCRVASRSLSHRSLFATGRLRPLSQPFSRHLSYQPLRMQLTR